MDREAPAQPRPGTILQLMNRVMQADADGLPKTGGLPDHLGAVVGGDGSTKHDLAEVGGRVAPHQGGMSVFLGEAPSIRKMMSKARWPAVLGGFGDNPLYQMPSESLSNALRLVPDPPEKFRKRTHAVVEPAASCPAREYQTALYATRPHWQPYLKERES